MADFSGNPTHLELVKKGTTAINEWRKEHPDDRLHLQGADLTRADLAGADLARADLALANLAYANLLGANLFDANLISADLTDANLFGANLFGANLFDANLFGAGLTEADLPHADLRDANLAGADLTNANLAHANFEFTNLTDTNFTAATLGITTFSNTDLSAAIGLETCVHHAASTVDVHFLRTANKLPRAFLRGLGLPDDMIDYLPDFFENALNYYSLFISYSTKDEAFANRLYHDLQNQGVRCWYSPEDIQGGKHLHEQIETAINLHDRVLLILSENSMNSNWVITELTSAFKREEKEKRRVLFPIRLVDFEAIQKWTLFDPDFGTDLAKKTRAYFIPDFSDPDQYQKNLQRLIRDLKANDSHGKSDTVE